MKVRGIADEGHCWALLQGLVEPVKGSDTRIDTAGGKVPRSVENDVVIPKVRKVIEMSPSNRPQTAN